MLFECWQQTVRTYGRERAVVEFYSGRSWSFSELDSALRRIDRSPGPVVFAEGRDVQFILQVLAAWRDGVPLCPIEPGQGRPPVHPISGPIAHLKSTSASTGAARWIAFTAAQLKADADQIRTTMGLCADRPNLGVISLAHSYGFSNLVLPLLLHGMPLILLDSPLPRTVQAAIQQHGPVTLPGVPALWKTWLESGVLCARIALAISAGAPLGQAVEQEAFDRFGLKIHNFYGASECGGIAFDRSNAPRADSQCVGDAMDGVSLAVGEQGNLQVRSAAVGEGYWPAGDPALEGGVFQSSDVAELRDGKVFLLGRTTDAINVAGRKVQPETIEGAILQHPGVRHCVVFGVDGDDRRGQEIVACWSGSCESPDLVRSFLQQRLPSWQCPRDWWFVRDLEPNGRGKISRAEWKERYMAERME